MWDVHTGNCVRVFLGHTNSVNCQQYLLMVDGWQVEVKTELFVYGILVLKAVKEYERTC